MPTSFKRPSWPSIGTATRFGLGWLILNMIPFVPALFTALPLSPYFPLCIESLVLVTALVVAQGTSFERLVHVSASALLALLFVYEIYDAVVYTAFHRSGILYEDLQFVDNLAYFLADIASWRIAGLAVLGVGVASGLFVLVRWSVRAVAAGGQCAGCRWVVMGAHVVAWPLVVVVGPALDWGTPNLTYQHSSDQVRVRTIAMKAVANAKASLRLHTMLDSLETVPVDSSYAAYDTLSLDRRPPIYVFAVESYGAVLDRHPDLVGPYRDLMVRTDSALEDAGWHGATARIEAPVRGGRSWLAIASLLTGVQVDRQLLYNRFKQAPGTAPHLVRFLDRQGYRTVALQPFTYPRPGLPVQNVYDFDVPIYRNDLQYRGPEYGLAEAPDQYSLNFAHHAHLAPSPEPYFLFFETVSSHALWNYGLPPYLSDWQHFNTVDGSADQKKESLARRGAAPTAYLPDRITTPRIYDQSTPIRYLQHVAYDLRVIRDYVTSKAPRGSLVVLLGDHQPPLLDTSTDDVPIHILTTDESAHRWVRTHGFSEGLVPSQKRPSLQHAGLYSLLVRLLVGHDGDGTSTQIPKKDGSRLPRYRPEGASPGLLVQ